MAVGDEEAQGYLLKELSEHSDDEHSSSSLAAPGAPMSPTGTLGVDGHEDEPDVIGLEMESDTHSFRSVATTAAVDEIAVRFMQPRLGIFLGDTNLGDVIVTAVDRQSEASGYVEPGMVLTRVAGKRLSRNVPTVAVHALLKNKSARPLMLVFSPHRRCADMLLPARLERPMLAKISARKRTPVGWRLCGQPGLSSNDHKRGIKRPAGVRKEDWLLALDASDLLCRRRIFNRCVCSRHGKVHSCVAAILYVYTCTWPLWDRWIVAISWRWKYVESTLSDVFKTRWNYRLLVRTMHVWLASVEDSLATAWLLGVSLSRWRNPLAYMAFNQWLRHVCKERLTGLCTAYSNLGTDERRERALEEPTVWHFDSGVGSPITPPQSGAVNRRGGGGESVVRQAAETDADGISSDDATEEDNTEIDTNRVDSWRNSSSSKNGPAPAPKRTPEPEPQPQQSWLMSAFGLPTCCVAE